MELRGGGFTTSDSSGTHGTHIGQSATPQSIGSTDGYTLTSPSSGELLHPDAYNTKINYRLPPPTDYRWTSGQYTVTLKVYDTDNNTLGLDCGRATWTFVLA